jgi:hypothetical protein
MGLFNQKINNVIYDFSCLSIQIANMTYKAIQSVSWTDARDHQAVYGASISPIGVTPGQYSGSGSIELLLADYQDLVKSVSSVYDSEFSISVIYTLGGNVPISERLPKNVFVGRAGDQSKGSDPLVRKLDFLMIEPLVTDNASPNAESDSLLGDIFRGLNLVQNIGKNF